MKTIFFILLFTITSLAQFSGYPTWSKFLPDQITDTTPPVAPTSIIFDTLGTDSTEMLITGWPNESGTTNWLAFKTTTMTVASDTSTADSLFYAADSITGYKHWGHGLTDNGTVYYMIVQYDLSANERVTTGSLAINNWGVIYARFDSTKFNGSVFK